MPTYLVTIPEVHERRIKIDASTPAEAVSLVSQQQGTQIELRYARTYDLTFWIAEELSKEEQNKDQDQDQNEDHEDA